MLAPNVKKARMGGRLAVSEVNRDEYLSKTWAYKRVLVVGGDKCEHHVKD